MATSVATIDRGFVAGSPEEWAMYLPVLQAFIEGKKIQCRSILSFGRPPGEWRDTSTIYQIRMCEWRIRPDDYVPGTWFIEYVRDSRDYSRLKERGVMEMDGDKLTPPEWPKRDGCIYKLETQRFEAAS